MPAAELLGSSSHEHEQRNERDASREELKQASLRVCAVSFEPSYQDRAEFLCCCEILRSFSH